MQTTKQTVGFLERVPLFTGLKPRQLEALANRFVERDYAAGAAIVSQGQGGEGFFVIVSGQAEAVRERADGEKVVVNTFGPTDFFGEMALLDDGLRTASVVAKEATHCLVLARWDFLAVMREDGEAATTVLVELARRFRRALDAL
jgi:CRP/FNR family transcriptional regulator, cyclic AMP receptor protein